MIKVLQVFTIAFFLFITSLAVCAPEKTLPDIATILDQNIKALDNTVILYSKVRNRPSVDTYMSFKALSLFGYLEDKMVYEELLRWDKQKPTDHHVSFVFDGSETRNYNYGIRAAAIFSGKAIDLSNSNTFESCYRSILRYYLPDALKNLNGFESKIVERGLERVTCVVSLANSIKSTLVLNAGKSYMPNSILIERLNNSTNGYEGLWEFKTQEWLQVKENVYLPKTCVMNALQEKSPPVKMAVLLAKPNVDMNNVIKEYTFQQGTTYVDYRDNQKLKTVPEKPETGFGSRHGQHSVDKEKLSLMKPALNIKEKEFYNLFEKIDW